MNYIVGFDGCMETKDSYYISDITCNALIEYNKQKKKAEVIASFPNYPRNKMGLHHLSYLFGERIFFCPDYGNEIFIYDLNNNEMSTIPIDNKGIRCVDSYFFNGLIWLFFANSDSPLISVEPKTQKVSYYPCISNELQEELCMGEKSIFYSMLGKRDGDVFSAIWDSNCIIHFNLDSMESHHFYLKHDYSSAVTSIAGNYLGISLLRDKRIIMCGLSGENEVVLSGEEVNIDCELGNIIYCCLIPFNEEFVLIPNYGERIYITCKEEKRIVPFAAFPRDFIDITSDVRSNWRRFYSWEFINDHIVRLYPVRSNMMLDIDLLSAEVSSLIIEMQKEVELSYWIHEDIKQGRIISENIDNKFDIFLKNVEHENKEDNSSREIGINIWNTLNMMKGD